MDTEKKPSKWAVLLKKFGIWGFLFFLVKGLAWLFIAWWVARG